MKTVNEVREEMEELEPIEFMGSQQWPPPKLDPPGWKAVNEEMKLRIKPKRIHPHPIEWVFLGVILTICGFLIISIIEGLQWIYG